MYLFFYNIRIHTFLFCSMGYNWLLLFILKLRLFLDVINLSSFKLTLLSFYMSPLFFKHFLPKIKICSRCTLCPKHGKSHFSKELWFFSLIPLYIPNLPWLPLQPPLCGCCSCPAQALILHFWILTFPVPWDHSSLYLDSDVVWTLTPQAMLPFFSDSVLTLRSLWHPALEHLGNPSFPPL